MSGVFQFQELPPRNQEKTLPFIILTRHIMYDFPNNINKHNVKAYGITHVTVISPTIFSSLCMLSV